MIVVAGAGVAMGLLMHTRDTLREGELFARPLLMMMWFGVAVLVTIVLGIRFVVFPLALWQEATEEARSLKRRRIMNAIHHSRTFDDPAAPAFEDIRS
jgi:hypothetical protein